MSDRQFDDVEGTRFNRSLGQISRAAPVALPGVIQGAQKGAVAGPWGAVAGGLVGGASRFIPPRRGAGGTPPSAPAPAPGIGRPAAGVARPLASVRPPPSTGAAPWSSTPPVSVGIANPAAAALFGLLQDPRLAQACAALAAGDQGQREISVAGTFAPPGAFLNLLYWLAQEAAQQGTTAGDAPVDGYLKGSDGSYVTDVANPAARARVLLERLQAERAGDGARTEPSSASAEQWLLDSGLAELVSP